MKTFRWLNKQGVECSEGFVLQSMHRHYYHYVEDGKTLKVIVEPGRIGAAYHEDVESSSFETWEVPKGQPLTAVEQERAKANVAAALTFMDIEHSFT
jgi:hypothetical protein